MLNKEEYVEQKFFYRTFLEQLENGFSTQEILRGMKGTLLTTTDLWRTIDFLITEIRHSGKIHIALKHLPHYFTPFQTFVIQEAEREEGRLDFKIALEILEREASYRSETPSPQGTFFYQFETISRNRLGFDHGLEAISGDPIFDPEWQHWINVTLRRQVGIVELADLIYVRSDFYLQRRQKTKATTSVFQEPDPEEVQQLLEKEKEDAPNHVVLFGEQEGRIAWASRKRDPAFLFAALARHLGYPAVPRPKKVHESEDLLPVLKRRLELMENKIQLLEEELHGGIKLDRFYVKK